MLQPATLSILEALAIFGMNQSTIGTAFDVPGAPTHLLLYKVMELKKIAFDRQSNTAGTEFVVCVYHLSGMVLLDVGCE